MSMVSLGHIDRDGCGQSAMRGSEAWRFYNATTWANFGIRDNGRVALQRMDNVGIVVESLDAAISFFVELGLELEGRAMIEGDWSGRVTGLRDQRVEIAMLRMPDGHGKIELSRCAGRTAGDRPCRAMSVAARRSRAAAPIACSARVARVRRA
jgi:hypothetical protein